jgi:hypothetical protein
VLKLRATNLAPLRRGGLISKHVHVYERIHILVMDLEETKARNDCAGEGQQKFNRLTDRSDYESQEVGAKKN